MMTQHYRLSVISGYRRGVNEICSILGSYRRFGTNMSISSSRVKQEGSAEKPVRGYHCTLFKTQKSVDLNID
jgi:hypothetical protein